MKPSRAGVLLGILGLGLVAGLLVREQLHRAPPATVVVERSGTSPVPAPSSQTAGPTARPQAQGRSRAVARMDLPPPNTPIGPVFAELVRAARAGDPGAMCRLAFEGHRCTHELRQIREQEEMATDMLVYGEPEERSKASLLRQLGRNAEKREELEALCAGVDLPPDLTPWRLLRDAARAGHVPSMLRFAESPPLEFDTIFDDMEALVAIRDERTGFLKRAAEAGNAKAAYVLFWDYTGNGSMFGRRNRDPVLALAYGLSIEGIGSEKMATNLRQQIGILQNKLGAAEREKAEQLAAKLAPVFAPVRGSDADLRRQLVDDGSDCAATDPRTLMLQQVKSAPAAAR